MNGQSGTTDLIQLVEEVRLLFHQLVTSGEELHRDEAISMSMRAVLEYLLRHGAATVPEIARSRGVTRQHIQALVNELLQHETVELTDNPAHKRSSLVNLTRQGGRLIKRMQEREAKVFRELTLSSSTTDLRRASKTLRDVRSNLGG